ncbi:hypothetical protein FPQ18DRAFT_334889 [Pyronema domesticum]|nr:hypothetical protein FPQ18DRAFT_334889 [Pyronema domesticum]
MCKHCNRFIKTLARHMREVHEKAVKYDCDEVDCDRKGIKGFGRQENLREHLRRVHDRSIPRVRKQKMGDTSNIPGSFMFRKHFANCEIVFKEAYVTYFL